MTWTLTTSGAAIAKAGANADSTIIASGSTLLQWCKEAEGYVCENTSIDWVTYYDDASTQVQNALSDAVSSKIAMNIIAYDTTGYTNQETNFLLNLNDGIVERSLSKLGQIGKSNNLKEP